MELDWERGDSSAFMLTGGSTKKTKIPFDTVGVPRFRHNKNFCYLCCDPVADVHAKLIPYMPV